MATFPVIYVHSSGTMVQNPAVEDFNSTMAQNPAVRSQSDGGYVQSRARFTRIVRRWNIRYNGVSQTNKNAIKTFEDEQFGGANSFIWTNPEDGVIYPEVRFLEPIVYTPWANAGFHRWTIEFVLEEV